MCTYRDIFIKVPRHYVSAFLCSALFGLGLFGLVDWMFQSDYVQNIIWKAASDRVGNIKPGDWAMWHMDKVVYARKTKTHRVVLDDIGEVILIGSSQVAEGFDVTLLADNLCNSSVRMMSIGAMNATQLLFLRPYFCIGSNDLVVLYISPISVGGDFPLNANAMRPFSSWQGADELFPMINFRYKFVAWRKVADLALAASSELWRSRDYLRHIMLNLGGLNESGPAQKNIVPQDMGDADAFLRFLSNEDLVVFKDIQFRALERSLQLISAESANLLVIEGQVNRTDYTTRQLQSELNTFLNRTSKEIGFTFISINDQGIDHKPTEWRDQTHLNLAGRIRLTTYLVNYLNSSPSLLPSIGNAPRSEAPEMILGE